MTRESPIRILINRLQPETSCKLSDKCPKTLKREVNYCHSDTLLKTAYVINCKCINVKQWNLIQSILKPKFP